MGLLEFIIPIAFLILMGFIEGAFFYYVLKIDVRKFMVALVLMFSIIVTALVMINNSYRIELWVLYLILTGLSVIGANVLAIIHKVADIYPRVKR